MDDSLITSKRPSKGQFDIIGTHAKDAAISVASEASITLEEFQAAVIMKGGELQQEFQKFLRGKVDAYRNEPHILQRKPLDLSSLNWGNWKFAERIGQRSEGHLDAGKIVRRSYQYGHEQYIYGMERFRRIKASPNHTQLDEQDFSALYYEPDHATLNWLKNTKNITWLSFWGVILRDQDDFERVLCLYWGSGFWHCSIASIDDSIASYPAVIVKN